jgi:hypothetical protein
MGGKHGFFRTATKQGCLTQGRNTRPNGHPQDLTMVRICSKNLPPA